MSSHHRGRAMALGPDLGVAIALLASALVVRSLPSTSAREAGLRAFGMMAGLVVTYYANAIPRARLVCGQHPREEQARRRFAGFALVLGGLAYVASWMFAPVEEARFWSVGTLGTAFIAVVVRCRVRLSRADGAANDARGER